MKINFEQSDRNKFCFLNRNEILLCVQFREKDFIEGIIHELTESSLAVLTNDILGEWTNHTLQHSEYRLFIEYIITVFAYPYSTIVNQIPILESVFKSAQLPECNKKQNLGE